MKSLPGIFSRSIYSLLQQNDPTSGFLLYTSPVGNIMRAFDISFHAYADDLQLYAEFDPRSEGDCERVLASCLLVLMSSMSG